MPYVPSIKTDGKSTDRVILDLAVESVAVEAASQITRNLSLIVIYKKIFSTIGTRLIQLVSHNDTNRKFDAPTFELARIIYDVSRRYNYEGAYLGELNYAITRLIQRVPQIKVANGDWEESDELRYWLYACTVEALTSKAVDFKDSGIGISGVFEDIKDEYKRRVNTAYEAAQILKSGDCYDAPYYTRLIAVEDNTGKSIGHIEVMLKRSNETLGIDVLNHSLVLKEKTL